MRLTLHIGWYAIRDVARNRWGFSIQRFSGCDGWTIPASGSISQGCGQSNESLPVS